MESNRRGKWLSEHSEPWGMRGIRGHVSTDNFASLTTHVQNNRVWRHEHAHRALVHPLTDESRSRFTNCSGAEDFYIFAWRRSLLIRLWLSWLRPAHRGLWDVTSLWLHLPKGVQPGDSPAFEWGWHVCLFNMNYIWKTRMTEVTSMTAGRENRGRH